MAKENGFANFTPNQAKEFIKEEHKNKPQGTFSEEETPKQKQKSINKSN